MTSSRSELLRILKDELRFVDEGGYRQPGWKPPVVFEDSPTCIRRGSGTCGDTKRQLLQLVPPEHHSDLVPCRHIVLDVLGETVDSLYKSGTTEELERVLRGWLRARINELETGQS